MKEERELKGEIAPAAMRSTRGLPSAARPPKTAYRACAFPFATSRLRVTQTACKATQPQNRCRTDLGLESPSYIHLWQFVSIRDSKHHPNSPWRLSVKIRVNPWRKNIRGTAPAFATSHDTNSLQSTSPSYMNSCPFVVQSPPHPWLKNRRPELPGPAGSESLSCNAESRPPLDCFQNAAQYSPGSPAESARH